MKKKTLIKLIAPMALAGVLAVTTVNTTAKADGGLIIEGNIKDPKENAKLEKWAKEDQTPEAREASHKLDREYLQEGRETVAIAKKLGIDPYQQRNSEQQKAFMQQIQNYKDAYGVPGSADAKQKASDAKLARQTAKSTNSKKSKAQIRASLNRSLRSQEKALRKAKVQLRKTNKVIKNKHIKGAKHAKAVKKQKNLKRSINSLNKAINQTKTNLKHI